MLSAISQPEFTGQLVTGLASLAALVVAGVTLFRRNPPVDATFATKAELEKVRQEIATERLDHKGEIASLRAKIDDDFKDLSEKLTEQFTELNTSSERRSAELHKRITQLATGLARVDERTTHPAH